ncbi:MAG: hypothetical protein E6J42_04990 [Chloroflexi bacterium]|nr:MAG: hypothetical protein E6J42_04990 [Chloroflexota bacterium]
MQEWDRGQAAQLVVRGGISFVLAWFGLQELRDPSSWAVFVPSFVADLSPLAIDSLILFHGFLLVLAAALILTGILYSAGCILAAGLLSEIVFGLWLDGGLTDLVVRDIGLLTVTVALALAPLRSWNVAGISSRLLNGRRAAGSGARPQPASSGRFSAAAVVEAGGLLALVLAIALLARATSGAESSLTSVASLPTTGAASGEPAGAPEASGATPDDWQYKRFAFQIYPGEINDDTKKALAGFDLSIQDNGDTVSVLLKALSSRYRDSQVTVNKNDTAYFIETTMRDDPNDQENNLRDDGIIEVDPRGYIRSS